MMKIWCVMMMMMVWALMLNSVSSTPLLPQNPDRAKSSGSSEAHSQYSQTLNLWSLSSQRKTYTQDLLGRLLVKHLDQPSHSDIIYRMKRSSKQRGALRKTDRKRPGREKKGRGAGGCALRHVQLRVSDLGLGYKSQEELIYSYCSGVCTNSLTNYDKILTSLTTNDKTILLNSPPTSCCRPIEYDDDLSFLDDNLIYHTMEKHSARKCGCV